MQMEDEKLKQYFKQARKPVKEDPSIKRKNIIDAGQDAYDQKI